MKTNDDVVVLEDVDIIFRNFEGKEGKYNRAGDRNFVVLLDARLAKALEGDGWNIKWLEPREEGDPEQPFVRVSVGYKGRPPRVVMISSNGRNELSEDDVEILDWVDIQTCDMILRPYVWEVNGKTGTKAYLKSLFITINEDELERKYAGVDGSKPPWDE